MIIRKPYAFLIKNFKKIHIFLFALCAYVLYKTIQLNAFIKQFMDLGTYDPYIEPVSKFINFFVYLFLFLIIASTISILILLMKKKKPWKMYILPIITYTGTFIAFIATSSFFANYTGQIESISIRALQDILVILTFLQYPTFLILIIRILGIDLNKFDFKSDEEFLELSEADRDEMEININIDKASFKRFFQKFKRNSGYFYQEHKKLVYTVVAALTIVVAYQSYTYIFVTNKSYKEGDKVGTSGYEIKINNSYYSDKDYKGEIISNKNSFVILDVTIKNNAQKRKINFGRFHVMNGKSNYSPTAKTYETQFQDIGTTYEEKIIEPGEEFNVILIYKVNKEEKINRFVLYYQEFTADNTPHLRKIKLNLKDVSIIKENKPLKLYDTLSFKIGTTPKEIIFDDYQISDTVTYIKENCNSSACSYDELETTAKVGEKILKLDFASNEFEGKDMIDFLSRYGTINYIDSNSKKHSVKIKNAVPTQQYYGKYVYIKVPVEVAEAPNIELILTVRNNKYIYKIK